MPPHPSPQMTCAAGEPRGNCHPLWKPLQSSPSTWLLLGECPSRELAGVDPKCPPLIAGLAKGLSKQFLHPLQEGLFFTHLSAAADGGWEILGCSPLPCQGKGGGASDGRDSKENLADQAREAVRMGRTAASLSLHGPPFSGLSCPPAPLDPGRRRLGGPSLAQQLPRTPEAPQPLLGLAKKLLCTQGLTRQQGEPLQPLKVPAGEQPAPLGWGQEVKRQKGGGSLVQTAKEVFDCCG